jgi:hypothetical protein
MSDRINPRTLGLVLGALVLAMIIIFMFVFKRHGLPKDPQEWRRLEQQRSADTGVP